MIHLGLNQDRYDCGVTLTDGARVLYAATEERFTRKKTQGGFPHGALDAALRCVGIDSRDVEEICVAGLMTPPLPLRAFPALQQWVFRSDHTGETPITDWIVDQVAYRTPLVHTSADSRLRGLGIRFLDPVVRRTLGSRWRHARVRFAEHHGAHAAAAWRLSGFETALALTVDGMGDGLSATVSRCDGRGIERLWTADSRASLGHFYETVTAALGFIPSRHEGKVTGLAAHGDAAAITEPFPFRFEGECLRYTLPYGRNGLRWARAHLVAGHRREDVARWAQEVLEATVLEIARRWLQRTGLRRVVLAGGVFANVAVNRRLSELDGVDEIFVCPNMGDGGLSLGAIAVFGGVDLHPITDVFWGDDVKAGQADDLAQRSGLQVEQVADLDRRVAELVTAGHLVALCRGRMEWGPRALGNRSIIAAAGDRGLAARLNTLLRRDDFMPFAPAVLAEDAPALLEGLERAPLAAELMTTSFAATARMRRDYPAVVHVDGTVRAQVVHERTNAAFFRILRAVKAITGTGIVLNTSFNVHEEPIVRTAAEAVSTFAAARLDALLLGDRLLRRSGQTFAGVQETL